MLGDNEKIIAEINSWQEDFNKKDYRSLRINDLAELQRGYWQSPSPKLHYFYMHRDGDREIELSDEDLATLLDLHGKMQAAIIGIIERAGEDEE